MKIIDDYRIYHAVLWTKAGEYRIYELLQLSLDFLDDDKEYDFVLFLKFDFPFNLIRLDVRELCASLELLYNTEPNLFVMLTHRQTPPLYMERIDEYLYSFSAAYQNFKQLASQKLKNPYNQKTFLFEVLHHISFGQGVFNKIIVKQLPFKTDCLSVNPSADIIIPHRGNDFYLEGLLFYLNNIDDLYIYIGLDQNLKFPLLNSISLNTYTKVFTFYPNPVGPYVIRNKLIDEGDADLIFFQDSDDLPCADRFNTIHQHMVKTGAEMCGSHEIKFDYYSKCIRAIRYPLDVKMALAQGPAHSLLHPASAITRQAFYKCERLSEERIFGNDTKFLYRSFFFLRSIHNIDEFLYIRRLHPDSLTTTGATKLGSPLRLNLLAKLVTDFNLIKAGKLQIEDSILQYAGPGFKFFCQKIFMSF